MSKGTDNKQRSPAAGSASDPSEPGVLTSLPSTRPQRASTRRATNKRPAAERTAKAGATSAKRSPKTRPRATAGPLPQEPSIPRQGFEAEDSIKPGVPVEPPGGVELAASVVELVGELAQAGLSTGGRLLKDTLARLPGI